MNPLNWINMSLDALTWALLGLIIYACQANAQTDVPRLRSLLYPGNCLEASPGTVGSSLSLTPCSGSATQHWLYYSGEPDSMMLNNGAADGYYHFLTDGTPPHLDVDWPDGYPQKWNWTGQYLRYGSAGHCIYANSPTTVAEGTCAGSGTQWTTTAGSTGAHAVPLGVYTGYGSMTIGQWETTLNRPTNSVMDYIFVADQGGWSNFDGSAWYWACSVDQPRTRKMIYGIGFFPAGEGATMAAAARGDYDSHYANAASQLAACGYGDSIVRIAWEFNCWCYPWSIPSQVDQTNYEADYRAAFQRMVNIFRSYSPNFKFVWNPNLDPGYYTMPTFEDTFPGSAYADAIGTDMYDQCAKWSNPPNNAIDCWNAEDANWLIDVGNFAAAQGVPMAFPEWAAGDTPLGDNPYFISKLADYIDQNQVAFAGYWNGGNGSGYNGDLALFPNQRAAMISRFGD